jgi:hypothetical protein
VGIFGSLFGMDQLNGAHNAVMANYLLEQSTSATRITITKEIVSIVYIGSGRRMQLPPEEIAESLNSSLRTVQMNFVALACDNLGIAPPVPNTFWIHMNNPYLLGHKITKNHIDAALKTIEKQNGMIITWPGNNPGIDVKKMCIEGIIHPSPNTEMVYGV